MLSIIINFLFIFSLSYLLVIDIKKQIVSNRNLCLLTFFVLFVSIFTINKSVVDILKYICLYCFISFCLSKILNLGYGDIKLLFVISLFYLGFSPQMFLNFYLCLLVLFLIAHIFFFFVNRKTCYPFVPFIAISHCCIMVCQKSF